MGRDIHVDISSHGEHLCEYTADLQSIDHSVLISPVVQPASVELRVHLSNLTSLGGWTVKKKRLMKQVTHQGAVRFKLPLPPECCSDISV